MKKLMALCLVLILTALVIPGTLAQSSNLPPERLAGLTHNIRNTGIMLPANFDPFTETYLLTVASWVSRVRFTPIASTNSCIITVNGQGVASGSQSQIINMTDRPQVVTINVRAVDGAGNVQGETTYTIFLQRRPSERRTKVSAGFITGFQKENNVTSITADLVTLTYQPGTNISTYVNEATDSYTYNCAENCLFYYGDSANPHRAYSIDEFVTNYSSAALYIIIYIEDEIVAVMPH